MVVQKLARPESESQNVLVDLFLDLYRPLKLVYAVLVFFVNLFPLQAGQVYHCGFFYGLSYEHFKAGLIQDTTYSVGLVIILMTFSIESLT